MNSQRSNPQRINNWWEVIYDPECKGFDALKDSKELLDRQRWEKICIDINIFNDTPKTYEGLEFDCVDFFGNLDGKYKVRYKNCVFNKVSFMESYFDGVKFTGCVFEDTSFSLSSYKNCEFRDCIFKRISVSGNRTVLNNTYIDSKAFLSDIYLNKNKYLLKINNTTLLKQKYELYKTKSVLARKIMQMSPVINDLDMLISSVRMARLLEIKRAIYNSLYIIKEGKENERSLPTNKFLLFISSFFELIFSVIEFIAVNIFGWLTGWGYKIGKTILIGSLLFMFFALLYDKCAYVKDGFLANALRSLEYGLLFGYTKYPFKDIPAVVQWINFLNSFFGMIWFSALIPVILNKMGNDDR